MVCLRSKPTEGEWHVRTSVRRLCALGPAVLAVAGLVSGLPTSATAATTTTTTTASGGSSAIQFSTTNANKANVNRKGQVIKIGAINDEGGPVSIPEMRIGLQQGVDYINKHGGVNGAKIELKTCLADGSPESSIACANKFVDEGVALATYGIDVSADATLPIYDAAGIPLVGVTAYGTKQRTDPNSFALHAASSAFLTTPLEVFKNQGVKKLAFIAPDETSTQGVATLLKAVLGPKFGLDVTPLLVNPTSPDYTAAVQSAQAAGADAIYALLDEASCEQLVTATSQVGYKGDVLAGACSQYVKTLGDKAVGTMSVTDTYSPDTAKYAPSNIQKNMAQYVKALKASGNSKYVDGFAVGTFASMQELRDILETIPAGTVDAKSVKAAVAGAKGIPGFVGPDVNCALKPWPTEPQSCRADVMVLKVENKDGKVVRVPISTKNGGFRNDSALAK